MSSTTNAIKDHRALTEARAWLLGILVLTVIFLISAMLQTNALGINELAGAALAAVVAGMLKIMSTTVVMLLTIAATLASTVLAAMSFYPGFPRALRQSKAVAWAAVVLQLATNITFTAEQTIAAGHSPIGMTCLLIAGSVIAYMVALVATDTVTRGKASPGSPALCQTSGLVFFVGMTVIPPGLAVEAAQNAIPPAFATSVVFMFALLTIRTMAWARQR